jgi:hypothetical protein
VINAQDMKGKKAQYIKQYRSLQYRNRLHRAHHQSHEGGDSACERHDTNKRGSEDCFTMTYIS